MNIRNLMNDTLKDIKNTVGDAPLFVYANQTFPEGYFGATFEVEGMSTTYLIKGALGDDDALIVGRVVISDSRMRANTYRGTELQGGEYTVAYSYAEAFNQILG